MWSQLKKQNKKYHSQFSPKSSQETPHSSPLRKRYEGISCDFKEIWGYFLWLIHVLPQSLQCCMQCIILDCIITAPDHSLTYWGLNKMENGCHLANTFPWIKRHWPLGNFRTCNFQTNFSDWWLRHLLWNCPYMNVIGLHWWWVTLVQVMAWCHQATSHYLSQCWPRSLSPYGVTRPQWVNPTSIFLSFLSVIYAYRSVQHLHQTRLHNRSSCHIHSSREYINRYCTDTPMQNRWHWLKNMEYTVYQTKSKYRKISNIRHTTSQNLNDPCLVVHLPLPNPLKPCVKSRMKM